MTFSATCPHCSEPIEIDDSDAGVELVCPWCEAEFAAPRHDESESFVSILKARGDAFRACEDGGEIARGGMGAIVR